MRIYLKTKYLYLYIHLCIFKIFIIFQKCLWHQFVWRPTVRVLTLVNFHEIQCNGYKCPLLKLCSVYNSFIVTANRIPVHYCLNKKKLLCCTLIMLHYFTYIEIYMNFWGILKCPFWIMCMRFKIFIIHLQGHTN